MVDDTALDPRTAAWLAASSPAILLTGLGFTGSNSGDFRWIEEEVADGPLIVATFVTPLSFKSGDSEAGPGCFEAGEILSLVRGASFFGTETTVSVRVRRPMSLGSIDEGVAGWRDGDGVRDPSLARSCMRCPIGGSWNGARSRPPWACGDDSRTAPGLSKTNDGAFDDGGVLSQSSVASENGFERAANVGCKNRPRLPSDVARGRPPSCPALSWPCCCSS